MKPTRAWLTQGTRTGSCQEGGGGGDPGQKHLVRDNKQTLSPRGTPYGRTGPSHSLPLPPPLLTQRRFV